MDRVEGGSQATGEGPLQKGTSSDRSGMDSGSLLQPDLPFLDPSVYRRRIYLQNFRCLLYASRFLIGPFEQDLLDLPHRLLQRHQAGDGDILIAITGFLHFQLIDQLIFSITDLIRTRDHK